MLLRHPRWHAFSDFLSLHNENLRFVGLHTFNILLIERWPLAVSNAHGTFCPWCLSDARIIYLTGGGRPDPPAGAGSERQPGTAWQPQRSACPNWSQPELPAGSLLSSVFSRCCPYFGEVSLRADILAHAVSFFSLSAWSQDGHCSQGYSAHY